METGPHIQNLKADDSITVTGERTSLDSEKEERTALSFLPQWLKRLELGAHDVRVRWLIERAGICPSLLAERPDCDMTTFL